MPPPHPVVLFEQVSGKMLGIRTRVVSATPDGASVSARAAAEQCGTLTCKNGMNHQQ